MSHSICITLNRAANEFQAGESVGFGIGGGVRYYDRVTKQKEWTNYKAVVFAKAQGQVDFYRSALIEGAIVEIGAKQQKISEYNGNYSIEFIDAWIGSINQSAPRQEQGQQGQQAQPQSNYNPAMDNQPASKYSLGSKVEHVANNFDDFDSDIPF